MEGQAEQQKKAYELLKGKQATQSSNPEFLWRMCKSMYLMAVTLGQEGDSNAKQELIFEAVDYGEKALGEFIFLEFLIKFILTNFFLLGPFLQKLMTTMQKRTNGLQL